MSTFYSYLGIAPIGRGGRDCLRQLHHLGGQVMHWQVRQRRCEAAQLVYIRWIGIMLGRKREKHMPSRLNGIKILTTHEEGSPILRLDDKKDEVQMRLQYGQNCRPRVKTAVLG
jgi:hypothetical protein